MPATAQSVVGDDGPAAALRRVLTPTSEAARTDPRAGAAAIRRFYEARAFQPLWVTPGGVTPRAVELSETFAEASRDGLDPARYAVPMAADLHTDDDDQLANLELDLTRSLIRYAKDLATGRVSPRRQVPKHYIYPEDLDPVQVLEDAAAATDLTAYLRSLAPPFAAYAGLRQSLAHYRDLLSLGGWSPMSDGPALKLGDSGDRVVQLRDRLQRTGELATAGDDPSGYNPTGYDPTLFDAVLASAVEQFQARHGLLVDGIVGTRTLAALNVSAEDRIRQIILNMERWRWMPRDLGPVYVLVNMAGFELEMVENDVPVLTMRVVVGKPYQSTPVFSDEITYIEINPYWNIPESIANNEILPKVRANPGYLDAQGIRILTSWGPDALEVNPWAIDWTEVSQFPFHLRQDPGPRNPLGRIKFMLPNRFAVYLHDTPSRSLFQRPVRTFSHGCIRLEKPVDFAYRLLRTNPGWSVERIQAAIDRGKRRIITLSRPVPVHLTYLTAWAAPDEPINFRNDIYGRDALLSKALFDVSG